MVVAGIGVSLATCANHPCATWKGLLAHGLQQCLDVCATDAAIIENQKEILNNPKTRAHGLTAIGQFITDELREHRPGCYGRWLQESIGAIQAVDTALVQALSSLNVKLATTNYDEMLTSGTQCTPITWRDKAQVTRFFRENTDHILHLHGHYKTPESVILGTQSYATICGDDYAQDALKSFLIQGTIVFVGCGTGLADPNFGALLDWARKILAQCHHTHFILVRSVDVDDVRSQLHGTPVEPVCYGDSFADLDPFLTSLVHRIKLARDPQPFSILTSAQSTFESTWDDLETRRELLGAKEYLTQSRQLAAGLRKVGGNRRAAMAFSSRVHNAKRHLLVAEHIEFAMDAAEWLLEEDLPELVNDHLNEIRRIIESADLPKELLYRFRELKIKWFDASCAYRQTLEAIDEVFINANSDEQESLLAEKAEIHFLQGNFNEAHSAATRG